MEYTIDVGGNLTALGLIFIIIRYLIPPIVALAVAAVVAYFIWPIIKPLIGSLGEIPPEFRYGTIFLIFFFVAFLLLP